MMDPIIPFIKDFEEYIVGVTCFAGCTTDSKEITIEGIKNIDIKDDYIYFIGTDDVLGVPIDGAIVDIDFENGENNLITVFNKKYGYIKTKKLPI